MRHKSVSFRKHFSSTAKIGFVLTALFIAAATAQGAPTKAAPTKAAPTKAAPTKAAPEPNPSLPAKRPLLLAHYMPWFVAKPTSEIWGWHWTMNAFDPDSKEAGKRRLASYYTPLIGPYDSSDPDVIEYHLLLMKLAGIDGLIVDWYGLTDHADYAILRRNSELLLRAANRFGLRIAVCYEDQTVTQLQKAGKLKPENRVQHVEDEIEWLRLNWFSNPAYLRLDGKPVSLSFGSDGLTNAEWEQVFAPPRDKILYLSEHRKRQGASGAFDWPIPGFADAALNTFYQESRAWPVVMPAAFPRFNDIYGEAKVQKSYEPIPDDAGKRFESTLRRAMESRAPFVQLVTWNDWGEGTIIEPSQEFGFRDLETTQRLRRELIDARFRFKPDDLRLAFRLYSLRKKRMLVPRLASAQHITTRLDEVARLLNAGSTTAARKSLAEIEAASTK